LVAPLAQNVVVFSEECRYNGWIKLARAGRVRCQLCTSPAIYAGLFVPTPELQRRLLAPPDKGRAVNFGLCGPCRALPDAMDRVDAAIVALADGMSGRAEAN